MPKILTMGQQIFCDVIWTLLPEIYVQTMYCNTVIKIDKQGFKNELMSYLWVKTLEHELFCLPIYVDYHEKDHVTILESKQWSKVSWKTPDYEYAIEILMQNDSQCFPCHALEIGIIPYKPEAGPDESLVFRYYNRSEVVFVFI